MLLAWPFLIGFGLTHNSLHWLLPLMVLLLLLRLHQARQNAGPMRYVVQCVALAGIALCAASYLLKAHQWLLLYPVVVNLVMQRSITVQLIQYLAPLYREQKPEWRCSSALHHPTRQYQNRAHTIYSAIMSLSPASAAHAR